jgi:hypothetical protein
MHEQHAEGIQPGPPEQAPGTDAFTLRKKFPGQAIPEPAPSFQPAAAKRKSFWRLLVPLALFIAIIGGIAFIVQYTPNWRPKKTVKLPDQPRDTLHFPETLSIWDPKDKAKIQDPKYVPYIKEFEPDTPGHYDYSFHNTVAENVEMGIFPPSCDCASVEAYLLPEYEVREWEKAKKEGKTVALKNPINLKPDERTGIDIPPKSGGVIRVAWKSRKGVGEFLRLNVRIWAQPKGKVRERAFVMLETRVVMVAPVLFDPAIFSLGTIGPGSVIEAQCHCWTATRDKLDLKITGNDPLITWTITPLSPAECADLQKQLRPKVNTRVKAACRLSVKVVEEKDKQQLDQGPLQRPAPLSLEDQPLALVPNLVGKVLGEVEVGNEKDHGKMNLHNFAAAKGVKKRLSLRSEPGTELTLDSQKPSYLKVQLRAVKDTSSPQKRSWILEVEVPPNSHAGPFSDDSAVILKTQATPPRYIRIPVIGTATPG